MGEVHEVVEDQSVVAVEDDALAVPGPLRIVVPVQVGDEIGVGRRGVAEPDPDEPVPLHDGVRSDGGGRVEGLLGRHPGAAAVRSVGEAVIAADDVVTVQLAHRQRHETVPAGIGERHRLPGRGAVEHEGRSPMVRGSRVRPSSVSHAAAYQVFSGNMTVLLLRVGDAPPSQSESGDGDSGGVRSRPARWERDRHAARAGLVVTPPGRCPPAPRGRGASGHRHAKHPRGMSPMNTGNDSQSHRQWTVADDNGLSPMNRRQ